MRDNDSFDDIPSVVPERDEIASYNRSQSGSSRSSSSSSAGMGGGAKFFLFLAFVLAVAAAAAAGYLFQELQKSNAALADATERLVSLEERLSSTDESVNESAAVQGVKIKELMSEVDKLWASAWRKNQAEIGKYSKQLAVQGGKLGKAESALQVQKTSLTALQTQLGDVQALSSTIKEAQSTSLSHQAQLSELDDTIAALKVSVSGMKKKVSENQEWVKSFNTFRKQTNSKLGQLESSINRRPVSQSTLQPPE